MGCLWGAVERLATWEGGVVAVGHSGCGVVRGGREEMGKEGKADSTVISSDSTVISSDSTVTSSDSTVISSDSTVILHLT